MKKNFLFLILIFHSCSWFVSDYSEIMGPIQKLKQDEKKAGKPNPIYNGYREPDFPNLKENNKSIDGIDSNKDGVRDDVEIWINRVSDDDYVRIELKHLFKTKMIVHKSVWNDEAIELQSEKSYLYVESLSCLSLVLQPYEKKYIALGIERNRFLEDQLSKIIFNTPKRQALVAKINSFQGKERDHKANDVSDCDKSIDPSYFELLKERYRRDWSKK